MRKKRAVSYFEILLLIGMTFAFSYIIHQNSLNVNGQEIIYGEKSKDKLKLYKILISLIFNERSFVSALDASDLNVGAYTCLLSKDGKVCQEYAASECESKCDGVCIPARRNDVSECKLGTCYDPIEGTCQAGSPRTGCVDNDGEWFDDPFENVPQCKEGCCVLGDQTRFVSDVQCRRQSALLGLEKDFRPEIKTELACLVLAKSQEEGACVFDFEFETTCKFVSKVSCLEIGGDFFSNKLCSNPELNTNCEKQASASCVEGRDELYWFDSCGNRENIYSANKAESWNNGEVLTKGESCSLGSGRDPLDNQASCGNCNYLAGSICGAKTSSEKLSDGSIDFVCRDLRCEDSDGQIRENGESWCAYQGTIGVDTGTSGKQRSVDTPGSRHFRQVCLDGEIRTEPCADYRNEICVEGQTDKASGGTFSSAACRLNRWQQCLEYNTNVEGKGQQRKATEEVRDNKCEQNPDCFIKEVNVDSGFKFNICAPKYPAGFDLSLNGESAEGICSLASQTCTAIYVKEISGWECKANCECKEKIFTEQMNDLCMSLGDCGVSVNYEGDFGFNTEGRYVKKAPRLGDRYLSELEGYADVRRGEFAEAGSLEDFYGGLGIPGGLGEAETPEDRTEAITKMALATGGLIGVGVAAAGYYGINLGAVGLTSYITQVGPTSFVTTGAPQLSAIGGALAGAGIGLAATALLIKMLGIGAGLDKNVAFALMAAGAVGGGLAGIGAAGSVAAGEGIGAGLSSGIGLIGLGLFIAVVVVILIFKFLGVGDTKEVKVSFSCQPWQAPLGGTKCEECGKDGLPCSRYACQALGQTCEFLNEGTSEEICENVAPNDVSAPRISAWRDILTEGFNYENENERGVNIRSSENDGCVKAYERLIFGIALDEPGQCRFDTLHTSKFDDMEFEFGSRNLFLYNHSQLFTIPSLESLGLPGYDPNRRADYSLYVRCMDKSGNKNTPEYAINFCVQPGDDLTSPIITTHSPIAEHLRFDAESVDVDVWTNEPSECKYSEQDKDYEQMENNLECFKDIEDMELQGWRCEGTLPITKEENKFYVRCLDQPWKAENATERNVNTQSYPINYKRSKENLKIDYIKPEDKNIVAGVEPVTVNVEVKTSGGVDGKAECSYLIGNSYIGFKETLGTIHKQPFQSFLAGEYTLPIRCEDVAGNFAEEIVVFNIELDTTPPIITRVYNDKGSLIVITNEDSECAYSLNSCSFDFSSNEIVLMSGGNLRHSSSFDASLTHYVKCKDRFENTGGACGVIVRGGI